jgi:hypothetical protein
LLLAVEQDFIKKAHYKLWHFLKLTGLTAFASLTISDWVSVTGDLAAVHVHNKVELISYLTTLLDT